MKILQFVTCGLVSSVCALDLSASEPNIRAWGNNSFGQCDVPSDITNAIAIAAGHGFSMALLPDGTVREWGAPANPPSPVLSNVVSIAAGASRMALRADGTIVLWGNGTSEWCTNTYGGAEELHYRDPSGITNVQRIAQRNSASGYALTANGSFFAVGCVRGCSFQIANVGHDVVEIAGGPLRLFYRTTDGRVGIGHFTDCSSMQQEGWWQWQPFSPTITNASSIATDGEGYMILLDNGKAITGAGDFYSDVEGVTNGIAITGGAGGFLVIRSDNSVIGFGTTVPPDLPFTTAVSVGLNHYLAIVDGDTPVTKPTLFSHPHPASQTVPQGSDVTFSILALGYPPITYQWFYNNTNLLSGATNSVLVLSNVNSLQSGIYSVKVCNPVGCVESTNVVLSVMPVLGVHMTPSIEIHGGIGLTYKIDYIEAIGPVDPWYPLATIQLTNSPQLYFDVSGIGKPKRFYRALQVE